MAGIDVKKLHPLRAYHGAGCILDGIMRPNGNLGLNTQEESGERRIHMLRHVVLLSFVAVAWGQVDVGRISGTVSDPAGAIVPGATVVVTREDTNVQITFSTNNAGFYAASALFPGKYRVSAAASGFRTEIISGIELRVQEHVEINF